MPAIVCELCGSNELIKTDGVFVCQHCGTKYSLEEAKKLLVELSGSVTVKVEKPDIEECLMKARQAIKAGLYNAYGKYIQDAFNIDPMNWQVIILRSTNLNYEYDYEKALQILKSQSGNPVNEFLSLWSDIKDDSEFYFNRNGLYLWKAFVKVFPEQIELFKQSGALEVWEENFNCVCPHHIEDISPYYVDEYEAIKKIDPVYEIKVMEKYLRKRESTLHNFIHGVLGF